MSAVPHPADRLAALAMTAANAATMVYRREVLDHVARGPDRRQSTQEWLVAVDRRVSQRRFDLKAACEEESREIARRDAILDRIEEARERSSSCWHDQS